MVNKEEKIRYHKYRVKIEYYSDVDNVYEDYKPREVVCADFITTVLDKQQIELVLRNQYEILLKKLHDKLEVNNKTVRAKWKNGGKGIYDTCTACNKEICLAMAMNYCPNCGAKLEADNG